MELDPVILALTQNRLDHISHQMGWVMVRTARSPIFSQAHDFSCFIAGPTGEVVSQADGIPIHTGSGGFGVRAILRDFGDVIAEDDVYLLNDPWAAGGNHLPDWVIARPIFAGGEFVGLTCNRAHQSDIGGGAAGAYHPPATPGFPQGTRLPGLALVRARPTPAALPTRTPGRAGGGVCPPPPPPPAADVGLVRPVAGEPDELAAGEDRPGDHPVRQMVAARRP
ncbi:MAG: hydantoinase B/oxoprolinase family protein, partial [Defluviicoccus sp.]|nr:hydantoinase B/oxoprolinase family protein [Defluviicoccus sp.]